LKKNFLSLEDVQYWNLMTKDILTKAFGPNSDYIDSILYAGEHRAHPVYEPDSILEKQRRNNFHTTLELLESCIEKLLGKEPSKPDTSKKVESVEVTERPKISVVSISDEEEKEPEIEKELAEVDLSEKIESIEAAEGPKVHVFPSPDEGKKEPQIDKEPPKRETLKRTESMKKPENRKVFIVHGHDEEKKEAVAKFLAKLDLEPVILHEQPSQGINLLEKFAHNSDVSFAIIILTGDDYGHPKGKPEMSKPRPRQNVVFELGFLIGRFKRNLICALHEEGLELPSDYQGAVFIPYDAAGLWKLLIARAMKMANVEIDLNKAI